MRGKRTPKKKVRMRSSFRLLNAASLFNQKWSLLLTGYPRTIQILRKNKWINKRIMIQNNFDASKWRLSVLSQRLIDMTSMTTSNFDVVLIIPTWKLNTSQNTPPLAFFFFLFLPTLRQNFLFVNWRIY